MKPPKTRSPLWYRRHLLVYATPVLLFIVVLIAILMRNRWNISSTAVSSGALFPFLLFSPLVAALQGVEVKYETQTRLFSWVPLRRRTVFVENLRLLLPAVASILASAGTLLLIALFAHISSPSNTFFARGVFSWSPSVCYLAVAVCGVCVAQLLGRSELSLAVCAIVSFCLTLGMGVFATQFAFEEPYELVPYVKTGALALFAGVACLCALLIAGPSARAQHPNILSSITRGYGQAFVAFSLAGIVIVTAALLPQAELRRPAASLVVCTSPSPPTTPESEAGASRTPPQICVWKEHGRLLPELVAIQERVLDALPPTVPLPASFQDFALDGTANASYSLNLSVRMGTDQVTLPTAYVLALSNHLFVPDTPAEHDGVATGNAEVSNTEAANADLSAEMFDNTTLFTLWLLHQASPGILDDSGIESIVYAPSVLLNEVKQVIKLPLAEQQAWAGEIYDRSGA
ncbi:hypothetical protein SAMN05421878_102211 [Actinobaculum suis]|uniref:Uncharacterized protein n=2 Tax=Actinobaculum suis TaxID=1657 RepID=A0A1G7AFR3_9ACTO|nr:hypothetical protein SAMN05421878_102211 [Actinobaculum suis]